MTRTRSITFSKHQHIPKLSPKKRSLFSKIRKFVNIPIEQRSTTMKIVLITLPIIASIYSLYSLHQVYNQLIPNKKVITVEYTIIEQATGISGEEAIRIAIFRETKRCLKGIGTICANIAGKILCCGPNANVY
jgi:hypothetical protein